MAVVISEVRCGQMEPSIKTVSAWWRRRSNTAEVIVLSPQLCMYHVIGWLDASLASSVCGLIEWRQFEAEVILLVLGWYLRFLLSYRNAAWFPSLPRRY
jgi:hypothetical protein